MARTTMQPSHKIRMSLNSCRSLWVWGAWLAGFYLVWILLNSLLGTWDVVLKHWPTALSMALGSFIAGSTPMGGGTVGFPVLVLLFDLPASIGRNFGLMVQSIGMTSAAIFIFCRRVPIEVNSLKWSLLGSGVGLLVGAQLLAPYISDQSIKLTFACLWVCFGLLTIFKNRQLCAYTHTPYIRPIAARNLGLSVGLLGGIAASLTGVGIDMICYSALVLLYRCDLKVAVPTSVVIMALTSIMGTILQLSISNIGPIEFEHWLAASPVVILGAPLGALIVGLIRRTTLLYGVSALCIFQFFWTLYELSLSLSDAIYICANLGLSSLLFYILYRVGDKKWANRFELENLDLKKPAA